MSVRLCCALWICLLAWPLLADGPTDNIPDKVRPIPKAGIALSDADRAELSAGAAQLGHQIDELRTTLKDRPQLLELLPDVQIYHNAVRYAVQYNEMFDPQEIDGSRQALATGRKRAEQLGAGQAPWTTATGRIMRGYVSRLDGSVQPYGLTVPETFAPGTPHRFRLDVWFHGRMETLSELNFIRWRESTPGEFVPPGALVLHPYGRYCNASKFAGEVDLYEALQHIARHYPLDENRLVARGFSMGGAACWHIAVHDPSRWVAAAPGAGFAETREFLRFFQGEAVDPPWWERKLWHWYDATDYALNLINCPTVAYSGEKDRQKQASDIMAAALHDEGIELTHIIGVGAEHQYTPAAKEEINRRIDLLAERGRDPVPQRVNFTTYTLRYPRCYWVELDGLEAHWDRARVSAELSFGDQPGAKLTTQNISALSLRVPAGGWQSDVRTVPSIAIDGTTLSAPKPESDRSWTVHLRKSGQAWQVVDAARPAGLAKRPGLQGPIDDAFCDSFLIVRPTGSALNDRVGAWTLAEMEHAIDHWRRQFRGEPRVADDTDVGSAEIAAHNLILWGDPVSNAVLAKIADRLPIRWTRDSVQVAGETFAADHHAPVLVFPNPLNPERYVVLNSGFTYREYDYLNNARQVPKLPDYAVIDLGVAPSSQLPGRVATAGFFDERWQIPSKPAETR